MAKQRYINTHFWDDGYVVTLDPIEKLLFIYFLTNPLTEIYGAYELPLRRIAFDTGIDRDAIVKIIDRFTEAGKVHYVDGWIVITNFIKHQALNPKIIAGIRDAMTRLPKKVVGLLEFEYAPKAKVKRKQVSPATRKRILQRDNGTCQICGTTENPEIDHIQPVVMGGDNSDANLRVLCQRCNGQRNADLRWNKAGDVEIENSLPSNMGSLSHLNSNLNRDSNLNLDRDAASPPMATSQGREAFGYPMADLIASFPSIQFTPAQVGFIEADVKDTPVDRQAWSATIKLYRENYDPMSKSYLPTKTGTLLKIFNEQKEKLKRGANSQNNGKRTPGEIIANREYR